MQQQTELKYDAAAVYERLKEVTGIIEPETLGIAKTPRGLSITKTLPDNRTVSVAAYDQTSLDRQYIGRVIEVSITPASPNQMSYKFTQYVSTESTSLTREFRESDGLFEFKVYDGNYPDYPVVSINPKRGRDLLGSFHVQLSKDRLLREVLEALGQD